MWGAPGTSTWGRRETAAAVAVAAVIAALGGGVIFAATGQGAANPGGGPGGWGPPPGMAAGTSLHSETTVGRPGGGYRTRVTQTGSVTDVAAGSVTVRSDDGFVTTYTLAPGTAPPTTGETVSVEGTRDGAATTLERLLPAAG